MTPTLRSNTRRRLMLALMAVTAMATSACSVRPHANVGLDMDYYGGGFHVHPTAHVGLSGRPK